MPKRSAPKVVGRKDDNGKLRWDLVPYGSLGEVVAVLTSGASRYGDNNWRAVANGQERYFAAAMRHITDYKCGKTIDKDSGMRTLAHAVCDLLFLMELTNAKRTTSK